MTSHLAYKEELSLISKMLNPASPKKLHLGCGRNYFEGWINVDNNTDGNITKLDLNFDLCNKLPFNDNSIDFIFNEHFLEHLSVEQGKRSLTDFLRVLKPGGVMRIAMPDLQKIVMAYLNDNWKNDGNAFLSQFGLSHVQTKAELLNINFRAWGHKWLYDWEELERRLREVGAKNITRCTIHKSEHIELCNLETRHESTLIAEVQK